MTTTHTPTPTHRIEEDIMTIPDCPTCKIALNHVEGTDVVNCNTCGYTGSLSLTVQQVPCDTAVQPDDVHAPGNAVVARPADTSGAVERLAEQALTQTRTSETHTLESMCILANILAASGIIPRALQGKPNDVLVILLTARALDIPEVTALSQVHVIDGKPTVSPKLVSARIAKLGMGKIVPGERSESSVEAVAYDNHGTRLGSTTFTWVDAQQPSGRNRLVDTRCQPNNHVNNCNCKDNWRNYGASRMLWQRARGYCADDFFPEASLGFYSPEEMGAMVNEEGEPITVESVDVPDGFASSRRAEPEIIMASAEEVAAIAKRISDLPSKQQTELKAAWKTANLEPVTQLTEPGLRKAAALISGFEATARREATTAETTADPDATEEAPAPPVAAPEATEGPSAPAGMAPDLAEQYGHAQPTLTEALVDGAVAIVKAMTSKAINDALRTRDLSTEGTADDRGARLAQAFAIEQATQDWDAANAAQQAS